METFSQRNKEINNKTIMYTILENARIVIALLKKHNIRHIVLSPGGSNIPIVQGVQQDPFFKCYSIVDERSAMYFAIGLYLQTGEPVATSCTSAQATRNYIPGLTEAYYKHAPILAITMSKHPRYLGQEYMQCPIQTSLPVDAVKKSYSLPRINNEHDRAQCVRTANEAILELTHHGKGPVQLNIEELDNETWVFDENIEKLPNVRTIKRYTYSDIINSSELKGKRVMLLIGEHRPFCQDEFQAIENFCSTCNVMVYSVITGNYHGKYTLCPNALTQTMSQKRFETVFMPDIVITIGGLTGDYAIYYKLFNAAENSFEHWRIAEDGDVVDTYGKLSRIYEMTEYDFFKKFNEKTEESHDFYELWRDANNKVTYDLDIPLSNLYAAIKLSKVIPQNSVLNMAILNSLRVWGFVGVDSSVQCYSNIAAFGIDGCMSTLIGESVATNQMSFLITGDLAFYYDMNSLGIRHINNNVRILLCNNNGGMEFKFGGLVNQTDVGSYIAADNHFKDSEGWAKTCGFKYIRVNTKAEFDTNLLEFIRPSDCPILMEIITSPENERKANALFYEKNWTGTKDESFNRNIKETIKMMLGESGVQIIKKIVKK